MPGEHPSIDQSHPGAVSPHACGLCCQYHVAVQVVIVADRHFLSKVEIVAENYHKFLLEVGFLHHFGGLRELDSVDLEITCSWGKSLGSSTDFLLVNGSFNHAAYAS